MKKFFLSLVLLAISAGALFAQNSTVATLNHNGEISVFYGGDAFKEAHAAAQHGDAITLSSGTFKAVDITKAITLRGAGMEIDSARNTLPTILQGDITISIGDSVNDKLTIEGIFHNFDLNIKNGLKNPTFLKCRFSYVAYFNSSSNKQISYANNRYIQCKISNCFNCIDNNDDKQDNYFSNCYIKNIVGGKAICTFNNCIVFNNKDFIYGRWIDLNELYNSTLYNCVLIGNKDASHNKLPKEAMAYNCISIRGTSTFQNVPNSTNKELADFANVFKTFKGTYDDTETFELLDSIKTKYLGNDGTEVGIYGGMLPFSPTPTNPQITKCKVAPRSTADGKLSVDIEVKSAE